MTEMDYQTKGTCSRSIHVAIDEEGIIRNAEIIGGCPGNTIGVAKLAIGRPATEVAEELRGIRCGDKPTSCPDQFALAIDAALAGAQQTA